MTRLEHISFHIIGYLTSNISDIILWRKPAVATSATLSDKQQAVFYMQFPRKGKFILFNDASRAH